MKTIVKETTWLATDHGWGNGYVFIPKGHPLHGEDYDVINDFVEVHGGLTFAKIVNDEMVKQWELDESYMEAWCVGFDTCHCDDNSVNWPESRVLEETIKLEVQLELVTENKCTTYYTNPYHKVLVPGDIITETEFQNLNLCEKMNYRRVKG